MKKEPLLIAFASQKGGVGKSAFTVLVASILHYQKGLKVGVVDCDSPQHSISRMRDRDIESVQESDFLKVALYRQHEQIRKRSYPVIKSNPEKAIEDLYRYIEEQLHFKIQSAHRFIRALLPTPEEEELLQIEHGTMPILEVEQVAFLDDGRAFEYAKAHHRGDKQVFRVVSIR